MIYWHCLRESFTYDAWLRFTPVVDLFLVSVKPSPYLLFGHVLGEGF